MSNRANPLLPVEDARARIIDAVRPTPSEFVALAEARGRTLAADVAATLDQPPFNASAMDGYAVRAEDVAAVPVELQVIAEVSAGSAFPGTLGPGEAARIFTGAPVPDGADAIVIQENTARDGDTVTVSHSAGSGRFIRPRGLDFSHGETLLTQGTRLGAREISLAASMNHPTVPVRRKPRVALLPTGDELVMPGTAPSPTQIISSNNFGLAAMVEHYGGTAVDLGIAGDSLEALGDAIGGVGDVDILVTLGGASVGDHDLVHRALTDAGMKPDFWKIAMRPGKPLMFGRLGDVRVLGLPGNPVSSIVCAYVFLRPLLDALLGSSHDSKPVRAMLGAELAANDERQDYLRASLSTSADGMLTATPSTRQDSSMLRTLAKADCLLIRPPFDPARGIGQPVNVLPIDF